MLYAINIENAHRHGDVMPQLLRLRYRQFKERQNYEVRVYKDMEYDQYDTPETVYLVWLDEHHQVCGTSRLNPTCSPYMLKELWADMIDGHELPSSRDVWEGTRICIDKALPGARRERIKWEIVLGYLEFGLAHGVAKYVGIMQNFIWTRVFIQSGWGADYLGPEKLIDGKKPARDRFMSRPRHCAVSGRKPVSRKRCWPISKNWRRAPQLLREGGMTYDPSQSFRRFDSWPRKNAAKANENQQKTFLVSRNITVRGHRTSVRLEPEMWDGLREICHREYIDRHRVVTYVAERISPHQSLSSAIRVFIMAYFREAATEQGHTVAKHSAKRFG